MQNVANLLWGVALVAAGFFMEPYIPLGDWRWLLIAVFFLCPNAWIYRAKIKSWFSPSDFDMPIRHAIRHILSTETHSYAGQRLAETTAFRKIHELMCAGSLAVVGTDDDFKPPKRIKPKECGLLSPSEVLVPQNDTTPEGFLFALIDERPSDEHNVHFYRALRVRSKQLYKHWPKVNGAK